MLTRNFTNDENIDVLDRSDDIDAAFEGGVSSGLSPRGSAALPPAISVITMFASPKLGPLLLLMLAQLLLPSLGLACARPRLS